MIILLGLGDTDCSLGIRLPVTAFLLDRKKNASTQEEFGGMMQISQGRQIHRQRF